MKNLYKTFLFAIILSLITISLTLYVQLTGEETIQEGCSYLDPITIDILAFMVGLFLIIEGFVRIFEHPSASLKRHLTRLVRIAMGCAILTIHILQFMHK